MTHSHQPAGRGEHANRVLEGFRAFGADYGEFANSFAAWLGLHSTDATALVEIFYAEDKGDPLTPTRLSERVSLTTGATANLLNRLERLGYVVRTRENADRRVVTLRTNPAMAHPAKVFFGPFVDRVQALVDEYPAEQVAQFEEFLFKMSATLTAVLAEGPPEPVPPTV
ncbi:helix-turn-helix domain-containing protein [Actinokineospora auranticolor]|uniref:DNA-binding MarR family transcriptional regulator n=1 Tax=Actinokineospora auranticolor TaxID=155976 RepID=A0A2S6GCU9_9PSEU|nr:helix-turn-helix domain-containing protein [Actinokineospora auranticolor]PPK62561.1 DNA-binding MarR family transcriptional regulator [Actinokineospora auranticolor]